MDTRPHGLHIQSNSVYPLRPEPDVSKGRSSDEARDGAARAGAGVPSAGAQVRLRGAAAALHAPALQRVGKRGDGDALPARTCHGSNYSGPRQRRPGAPPPSPPWAGALLPGAHAPSPASCSCTGSAVGRRPGLRGGACGGRTLEAERRARGAGNGPQRQAGCPRTTRRPALTCTPACSRALSRAGR